MNRRTSLTPMPGSTVLRLVIVLCMGLYIVPVMAVPLLYSEAGYEKRTSPFNSDKDIGNVPDSSGTVSALISAPSVSALGPARGEAYADTSGTFWASATAGALDAYETSGYSVFLDDFVRPAGVDTFQANISGAALELVDYGGGNFNGDLFATIAMTVQFLIPGGPDPIFNYETTLKGRGGSPDSFELTGAEDFQGGTGALTTRLTPGGIVYSKLYELDPVTLTFDLDALGIGINSAYSVALQALTFAGNTGGETSASAWFRDPVTGLGGITVGGMLGSDPVAVDAPPTIWLVGSGIAALFGLRRRRNHMLGAN